jgi:hypothetical protein
MAADDPDAIPQPPLATRLLKQYTMQHSACGHASDYFKRSNCLRVRVEGEQFLMAMKDIHELIRWCEGLQMAENVSLDLDERAMPRGPQFRSVDLSAFQGC